MCVLAHCPRTWDGWSCYDDMEPDRIVHTTCPKYILYGSFKGKLIIFVEQLMLESLTF